MEFTMPWVSLFGGMLLGLSAALLMLFSGKIAGINKLPVLLASKVICHSVDDAERPLLKEC